MCAVFCDLVVDLLALPVPTVTTVTGHAAGAGCALALAPDVVAMRASRGFSLLARAATWPAGEPARWAPCCGGGGPRTCWTGRGLGYAPGRGRSPCWRSSSWPATSMGTGGSSTATRSTSQRISVVSLCALSVRPCFSTLLVQRIDIGLLVRYIVAIGLLAFVYTTLQLLRHGVCLTSGQDLKPKTGLLVDFARDQVPLPAHSQHLCSEFCLLGISCSIFLFPIAWNLFQSTSLGFRN
jgi:hypothetical protein